MEYASKGLGVTGATLGGVALGTSLLGGGNLLGNLLGGNRAYCAEDMPVSRGEMKLIQENAALKAENAQKDAYIYTDQQVDAKLEKAVNSLKREHDDLEREVRCNKDAQNAINMQQAVYNGTNTATIACIQGQVSDLLSLTKRVVPNGSVCPGWGDVTITPATTTTTTGA